MTTWKDVNLPPEPVLLDAAKCCAPINPAGSPIDAFYDTSSHILTLGSPEALEKSHTLGRLLVLGLVTGTEAYFRAVLLGAIAACPIVRDTISEHQLPFGAVDFYGVDSMALGLLEGISFASAVEIKKRTKSLIGLTWSDTDSLGVAAKTFDKVCHMRHAAAHAQGVLNRGNVRALGIARAEGPLHVVIDLANLHLAAKACSSLVRAYNTFLYTEILQRWLNCRMLTGNWLADRQYFNPLFELFRSRSDGISPRHAFDAYRSFLPSVRRRLADFPTEN